MDQKQKEIMKLSNEILEIIDEMEEFTRGDFQGIIESLTGKIYTAGERSGLQQAMEITIKNTIGEGGEN